MNFPTQVAQFASMQLGQLSPAQAVVREVTHIVRFQSRQAKEACAPQATGAPYPNELFCTSLDEARGAAIGLVEDGTAHPATISIFARCELVIRVEVEGSLPVMGHT